MCEICSFNLCRRKLCLLRLKWVTSTRQVLLLDLYLSEFFFIDGPSDDPIVVVNTPHYLRWLLHQFITQGGQVQRATLSHIQDVFGMEHRGGKPDAVVNCTGLGARYLDGVNDIAMFPTRGQTVVVWAPHVRRTITRMGKRGSNFIAEEAEQFNKVGLGKDYITYVIPRSDGTVVLGGTMDKND